MAGVIDYWCNAFTPDRRALWEASIAEQGLPLRIRGEGPDGFAEPDAMLERMDELGIAVLVIPTYEPGAGAGVRDYEPFAARPAELDAWWRRHPGRFAGAIGIDPRSGLRGVRSAAPALDAPWAAALHLHTHGFDRPFDSADYYPWYALAAERGVPVVMQAGASGGLFPSACGRPLGIDRPALYFRDVDFVLSHTGWPWVDEAVAMALKFPNVHLGTATFPPRRWPAAVVDFARGPGRRKTLFGTGFPLVGHTAALAQIEALELGPEARARVLGENARAIFARLR